MSDFGAAVEAKVRQIPHDQGGTTLVGLHAPWCQQRMYEMQDEEAVLSDW